LLALHSVRASTLAACFVNQEACLPALSGDGFPMFQQRIERFREMSVMGVLITSTVQVPSWVSYALADNAGTYRRACSSSLKQYCAVPIAGREFGSLKIVLKFARPRFCPLEATQLSTLSYALLEKLRRGNWDNPQIRPTDLAVDHLDEIQLNPIKLL
jgi:hypothetical protein